MEKQSLYSILKTGFDKHDKNITRKISNKYYSENYSKLRWSSLFISICQIIFILRDSLAGFYLEDKLNYINLGIEIFMATLSMIYFLYSTNTKKEWENNKFGRIFYYSYLVSLFVAVVGYNFTDMYVRNASFGICVCFLFVPIIAPLFSLTAQTALFGCYMVACGTIYVFCIHDDPLGIISVLILPALLYLTSLFLRSYYLKIIVYKEKAEELMDKLTYRNRTDYLTDVANRFCLYEDYKNIKKSNKSIGILIYDIDDFKMYNDTFSHISGDECLKRTSKAVKDFTDKNNGNIYRYGGEEFVVMFNDIDEIKFYSFVSDLNTIVYDLKIQHAETALHPYVSISIGATYSDNPNDDIEKILLKCDNALYNAKSNGKNTFVID